MGDYALYRYFDASDKLLYVGITGNLANRDSSHIARSRWMQLTARSTVERLDGLEEVRAAEKAAIETERPLFNIQYNDTPEARKRLKSYLEEIGRMDLLSVNTESGQAHDRAPAPAPESPPADISRKLETAPSASDSSPTYRVPSAHAIAANDAEGSSAPLRGAPFEGRFGLRTLKGTMEWLGGRPMTEDDAAGVIDALTQEFPDLWDKVTVNIRSACREDALNPHGSRIEIAGTPGRGYVHFHVFNGQSCAEMPLHPAEARAVGEALVRHADNAASPVGARQMVSTSSTVFKGQPAGRRPAA